jgi:hypothetical protein
LIAVMVRALVIYYVIVNYTESKQNQSTTRRQTTRDVTVNRGAHSTAQHDLNSNAPCIQTIKL